jgi:hypothetical protein
MAGIISYWPSVIPNISSATVSSSVNATGDKIAFIGQVQHPLASSGKSIERVGFRFGTVTKNGGSALTVSLQDVDLTSTTVPIPDGVQDQTVAIANSAYATNSFTITNALSANRSIVNGEWLAVVVEYDGAGRLGSDNFQASAIPMSVGTTSGISKQTAGVWTGGNIHSSVALICTDGTVGTLSHGGWFWGSQTTRTWNAATNPDERGCQFTVPVTMTVDGVNMLASINATNPRNADFNILIYENGTLISTTTIDASATRVTNTYPCSFVLSDRVILTAGNTYILAVKPLVSGENFSSIEMIIPSSACGECMGYFNLSSATRNGGGSWTFGSNVLYIPFQFRVVDVASGGGNVIVMEE